MLLLLLIGAQPPPLPDYAAIRAPEADHDDDEAMMMILSLFSAHYRVGNEPQKDADLTNRTT